MHTLHYIAVEADSKQQAFDKVVVSLLPNEDGYRLADWSDWHVVGGGRWSSNANKENNLMAGYNDDPTDVLGKFISDMVDYASEGGRLEYNGDTIMNAYTIKEVATMLMGGWTPDSGLYDLEENIAEATYLKERLDKPEQSALQYLVPVDFHF